MDTPPTDRDPMDLRPMELRPTVESRRVAALTAAGAVLVAVAGAAVALSGIRIAWVWWAAVAAAIATLLPAVGALTSRVTIDDGAVVVHRFGRARRFDWATITNVGVVERQASLGDGTEYHWFAVQRAQHVVAVPCLELVGGSAQELAMLASRAADAPPRAADQNADRLNRRRPPAARGWPAPSA